jgi:hypothetical protein
MVEAANAAPISDTAAKRLRREAELPILVR